MPAANNNTNNQLRSGWGTVLPKQCEYLEITKEAPNGQKVYDATATGINHQMSGVGLTIEFAGESGIANAIVQTRGDGTFINSDDADWIPVESNKELAAKKYLRMRYKGNYITGRLAEINLDTLHSWEIYAHILEAYGAKDSDNTETAKRARSHCALKMLRTAHKELYDIIEGRQVTFPSALDGKTYVVDDFTSIPAWTDFLTAEIFRHNKLLDRVNDELSAADLEQVATEDRLLHRLRSSQSPLRLSCQASLGATAMLNSAKKLRGKAPPSEGIMAADYDLGYLQALVHLDAMYEGQRPEPPRNYSGLVAAVTETEPDVLKTPPKKKTRLVKGDCINFWTGGQDGRGCKFDNDECHFRHGPPSAKGSIPYQAKTKKPERRFLGKCYKCDKTGHRAADCPEQNDTIAAAVEPPEQIEETVTASAAARQTAIAIKLAKAKWKREYEEELLTYESEPDDSNAASSARPAKQARINGVTMSTDFGNE